MSYDHGQSIKRGCHQGRLSIQWVGLIHESASCAQAVDHTDARVLLGVCAAILDGAHLNEHGGSLNCVYVGTR